MVNNWLSIHIFYASNPLPLLTEMLEPLVNSLRAHGLIQRYFFIRYWQEGPHVRLRLLLTERAMEERVKREAEEVINAYLRRRPALYDAENEQMQSFYKDMYIIEYGQQKWDETYGTEGRMPLRPNNSLHYIDYEPEYNRYGGREGVEVAEWHFEKSSEIVLKLISSTNLHVRTILLGLSIQLTLPLCFGLLEDEQRVIKFLTNYESHWLENYHKDSSSSAATFEKKFMRMSSRLQQRIAEIRSYALQDKLETLTSVERAWIEHIRELRERIDILVAARKLIFQDRVQNRAFIPELPLQAYNILLGSYVHMTNNRLGVLILDEIYLAYLQRRALEEAQKTSALQSVSASHEVGL
ncbi:lantibiotic biosynthesis protein [Ktedonosporobacter rubrisoli]|uniref:Lantibiotic biosynthesis protein n=1 Tax=Ktedonosporobacter rubrisoli TaxID=2509675 RepID=A0A4P6K4U9_KTERU|nr:thiopeptide-type bacteriocin biosynthesis protein [Ktedonosporobacter rubrisoli]QBD82992.1 lantibiotic biosynthesis protein [Ktedonosporobacter rubrisoli]